jgi:hypothetical protein
MPEASTPNSAHSVLERLSEVAKAATGFHDGCFKNEFERARSAFALSNVLRSLDDVTVNSFPMDARAGVRELRSVFDDMIRRLKWEQVVSPDGEEFINERHRSHQDRHRRYLETILSVANGRIERGQTLSHSIRNRARLAEREGLSATVPFEVAEQNAQDLHTQLYFTPVISDVKAEQDEEEDDRLRRAVAAIQMGIRELLRRLVGPIGTTPSGRTGLPRPKRRPGGRPKDTDPKADRRIAEAWQTGTHSTFADLARALGTNKRDVKLAIDRHRHRHRRLAGKARQGD